MKKPFGDPPPLGGGVFGGCEKLKPPVQVKTTKRPPHTEKNQCEKHQLRSENVGGGGRRVFGWGAQKKLGFFVTV